MVMEILTIGQVSKIYTILQDRHQRKIAEKFGTTKQVLLPLLKSLTVTRNKCAHHQRVWNLKISSPPNQKNLKKIAPSYIGRPDSPCVGYFMIWFLLKKINKTPTWGVRLCEQLFELDETLFHQVGTSLDELYAFLME
jgi:abortive infection bacteriophage resistance protein